jgi:hypothetical protein
MRPPSAFGFLALALSISCSLVFAGSGEPFSIIPVAQRDSLSKRITAYVEAYKARDWEKLYGLVSNTGKGEANQKTFIAAMKASHGRNFAQMPDLQRFDPKQAKRNEDGYDIYGCGKAEREGRTYRGIAVLHAVLQNNGWYFTGWSFTEFPNEPCKDLSDSKWAPDPDNEMGWDKPMDEITNFKQQGVSFHLDAPE